MQKWKTTYEHGKYSKREGPLARQQQKKRVWHGWDSTRATTRMLAGPIQKVRF
jgi:hypothetical protein